MTSGIAKWIEDDVLKALEEAAWQVREHARVLGKTKVGSAALSRQGQIWVGCNIEHQYRSHDVHAEVNAIGNMVAGGQQELACIFVAAERERFTPCGSCLDWIFEFGGEHCLVVVQSERSKAPTGYAAAELMPYYPR
jgi:cytidine deaminase